MCICVCVTQETILNRKKSQNEKFVMSQTRQITPGYLKTLPRIHFQKPTAALTCGIHLQHHPAQVPKFMSAGSFPGGLWVALSKSPHHHLQEGELS